MKTIIVNHHCERHVITIENGIVSVFNEFLKKHVNPNIFDKEIFSKNSIFLINSEEVFRSAARKRSKKGACLFIGKSMCWLQGEFEVHGWND